jgi:gamma-glutamyltranspeptidase
MRRPFNDAGNQASQAMGHAGAIVHHPTQGFEGASDPRSDGAAIGCIRNEKSE